MNGKSALVTGGSRGIGAAIARRLASDGASVAITYASSRSKADEVVAAIQRAGGKALAIAADSADAAAVAAAVDATAKAFGRLDVLVNNAGVAVMAPIDEFELADFDRVMAVNARAVFVAAKAAARHLPNGGRIITIGSVNADRMPFVGGAVYAMSKAAVAGLTRGLARDFGARGVTVNTVQPGPVDTDMNPAEGAFAESLKALMSMPRYGKVEEIASLVAWLAGPESGFMTGACLTIDGGFAT
jgi:3-oxoacyl-[acyl-carrier protein] reductase